MSIENNSKKIEEMLQNILETIDRVQNYNHKRINKRKSCKVKPKDLGSIYTNTSNALYMLLGDSYLKSEAIQSAPFHKWRDYSKDTGKQCTECLLIEKHADYSSACSITTYCFATDTEYVYPERTSDLINKCSGVPYKVYGKEQLKTEGKTIKKPPRLFKEIQSDLYKILRYLHESEEWYIVSYPTADSLHDVVYITYESGLTSPLELSIPYIRDPKSAPMTIEIVQEFEEVLIELSAYLKLESILNNVNIKGYCCHPIPIQDIKETIDIHYGFIGRISKNEYSKPNLWLVCPICKKPVKKADTSIQSGSIGKEKNDVESELTFPLLFKKVQSDLYKILRWLHESDDWSLDNLMEGSIINDIWYYNPNYRFRLRLPYLSDIKSTTVTSDILKRFEAALKVLLSLEDVIEFGSVLNDTPQGKCCHPILKKDIKERVKLDWSDKLKMYYTCPLCPICQEPMTNFAGFQSHIEAINND